MKKFKIVSTILLLSVMMLPFTNVFAYAESDYYAGQKIELGKYSGTVIDEKDLPEGMQPIKVDSIKEAEALLEKIEAELSLAEKLSLAKKNTLVNPVNGSTLTDSNLATRGTGSQINNYSFISGLYIKAYYTYSTNPNRFGSCTDVASYISGRPYLDWRQTNGYGVVLDSGRTLGVSYSGYLDTYILINSNFTKMSTDHYSLYTEFYSTGI